MGFPLWIHSCPLRLCNYSKMKNDNPGSIIFLYQRGAFQECLQWKNGQEYPFENIVPPGLTQLLGFFTTILIGYFSGKWGRLYKVWPAVQHTIKGYPFADINDEAGIWLHLVIFLFDIFCSEPVRWLPLVSATWKIGEISKCIIVEALWTWMISLIMTIGQTQQASHPNR